MSYSCTDFTDTILDALGIEVPEVSWDSPSDQADAALAVIEALMALPGAAAVAAEARHDFVWPADEDEEEDEDEEPESCLYCEAERPAGPALSSFWKCACGGLNPIEEGR